MAGNKLRNVRNGGKKKVENEKDEWKDSEIVLKKDYQILKKPFDTPNNQSGITIKEGIIIKPVDFVNNHGRLYAKIKYPDNNSLGYLPIIDTNGKPIFEKYRKGVVDKKNEKKKAWKYETCGSIKLDEAFNYKMTEEDIKCNKNKDTLINRLIPFMLGEDNSSECFTYENTSEIKKAFAEYYVLVKEMEKKNKKI